MRDLPVASRSQKLSAPPSSQRRRPLGGVTALHDELGNRGVQHLIHQKTLRIGSAHDPAEKEADRMADHAVASLGPRSLAVDQSGRLEPETRFFFESRFGHDLGNVRVHTESQEAESLGALAFNLDEDIVFGPGEYAPENERGRRLFAHELAHVAQREGAGPTERGVLRRQVAGAPQTGTSRAWNASQDIVVGLVDTSTGKFSVSDSQGNLTSSLNANLFSQENTVCANVPLPIGSIFNVDFGGPSVALRPGTWLPDVLRAFVTFNPAGGGVTNVIVNAVGTGVPAPGMRGVLVSSFGNTVSFTPPGLGNLFVYLSIYDPSSGVSAIYVDTLPAVFCQAPPKPKPTSVGHPTPYWVTPDPTSPSGYRTLGGPSDPGWDWWDQPAPVPLWQDDDGYFFWENNGEKHRLGTELP